jgi:hypothetical protein
MVKLPSAAQAQVCDLIGGQKAVTLALSLPAAQRKLVPLMEKCLIKLLTSHRLSIKGLLGRFLLW